MNTSPSILDTTTSAIGHIGFEDDAIGREEGISAQTRYNRKARFYRLNHKLRRLGLKPSPMGHSTIRDTAKDMLISAYLKTRKLFVRGELAGRL